MRKRIVLATAVALLVLVGCYSTDGGVQEAEGKIWTPIGFGVHVRDITVNGTRCVVTDGEYSGAIACDFR
jgi:hypothetical protein